MSASGASVLREVTMDNSCLDDVCKQLRGSFDDVLVWKWDGRFGTALAEFPAEDKEKVLRILESFLVSRWDSVTIGEAPEIVQQIKTHFGGLMSGQLLLLSDPNQDALIYCAWWPWGNGKTISIRVGAYSKEIAAPDKPALNTAFRNWFKV
jgi:hypothetical protein